MPNPKLPATPVLGALGKEKTRDLRSDKRRPPVDFHWLLGGTDGVTPFPRAKEEFLRISTIQCGFK
jgi:hypothetical protein